MPKFKDANGTEYSAEREGVFTVDKKGARVDGFTIRRVGPRPVDIKRAERAKKKAKKAAVK